MDKYTLAVTSPEDWSTIHNALIVDSNEDGIPDRKITCADSKDHSPTRGTYELTEAEATEIGNHPKVKWIELSPSHHPHSYPKPEPTTKRFRKNVKVYRDLDLSNAPPASPTSAEENRTNWAMKRVGFHTNGDCWPGITGSAAAINSDLSYSLTGKNVDVVIQDSGILQYHPEFLDNDGKSRVRDIVLDGPYYIDPSYFTSNSHTYTKPDGRTGITTASAHAWWENSSSRSGAFSSVGTVAIPDNYTVANTIGIGGTSHTITDTHGTMVASLAGGTNFGTAFESNLWNLSVIADPTSMTVEKSYDLIKLFHQNKPVTAGRQNPTVCNGSWGYVGGFDSSTTVSYKFKGSTGTFTGYASNSTGVQAYAYGLRSGSSTDKGFATSSRSHSTDVAGTEMVEAGVIFVVAAGNDNQRLGIGTDDIHKNDYFTSTYSGNDHRGTSLFPSGTLPVGNRDYLHPQGVGFSTATDSHPVICVGAMDDYINEDFGAGFEWMIGAEQAAVYSNNGPGIDVWAPADELLAAGVRASNGDKLSSSDTTYPRYNSNFVDQYMNGTSAASPVTAGVIALFLETNPSATSDDVKNFIKKDASVGVSTTLYLDSFPDDDNQYYWSAGANMRGAERRILYNPYANDVIPSFSGVSISGISFQQT